MKLGVALPVAGVWGTPDNVVQIAQRAEALGYHSLWLFQRLLYAVAPKNEYPPAPGQPWPKAFERVLDPTGLTELFLEANFDPTGTTAERFSDVMEAFAPSKGG